MTPDIEPLTLNHSECARLLGLSRPTFRKYRALGHFAGLEAPIPGRWSRPKVEAWLRSRGTAAPQAHTVSACVRCGGVGPVDLYELGASGRLTWLCAQCAEPVKT